MTDPITKERARLVAALNELEPNAREQSRHDRLNPGAGGSFEQGFREGIDAAIAVIDQPVPGHQKPGRGTSPAPTFQPWTDAVIEAMHVWGGGFVKALADAYLRADADNRRRILEVWDPLYGAQYREAAKRIGRDAEETLDLPVAKTGNCVGSIGE